MKIFAEFVGVDGISAWREIFLVWRNTEWPHLKGFGLTLDEGNTILQRLKFEHRQFQVEHFGIFDRKCRRCERRCAIRDYRREDSDYIATRFT